MTNEDIYKRIKNYMCGLGDECDCATCTVDYCVDKEILPIIKTALMKQTAISVKEYPDRHETFCLCPTCGSMFVERNGILMNYCNNCGQAVKK